MLVENNMTYQIKFLILIFLKTNMITAQTIVDFKINPTTKNWSVVDDVVMGGRSSGEFSITNDGYGKFSGEVSLENNGGFSSVKYDMETLPVKPNSTVRIHFKGDGNTYQFRIKDKRRHSYSYITTFDTTGDWQTLEFKLSDFYPIFRGRKVDLPNFDQESIEELRFLIGNKKPQRFQLLLESILILK